MAWAALKPLYANGVADAAVVRFRASMSLPRLPSLAGSEPASVDAVLASYDHSNTVNLLALGALVAWLRGEAASDVLPERGPRLAAPDVALPTPASQEDVAAETWQRVLRLNRMGDVLEPAILASMYRHLAHAPAFLARLEAALAPVQADGSLDRAIAANRSDALRRARRLAPAIAAVRPSNAASVESSVAAFVDHAIGKMVTICRAIRVARGTWPSDAR